MEEAPSEQTGRASRLVIHKYKGLTWNKKHNCKLVEISDITTKKLLNLTQLAVSVIVGCQIAYALHCWFSQVGGSGRHIN
jgi:hypothetical protein